MTNPGSSFREKPLLPPVPAPGKEEEVMIGVEVPITARSGKQNLFHVVEFIIKN